MTIGEQIQTIRISKGMTQECLAELLDVSRQSISKWELGQSIPDVEKIIRMSELFQISTDTLLLRKEEDTLKKANPLHLGCIYLVVKDFEKSVDFYEKFLGVKVTNRCRSGNKFVKFYIDNNCISLMNENNIKGHCTDPDNNIIEITGGYHMNIHICQSCGMKMHETEYGANADGSTNKEYCKYCLPDGRFSRDVTMEEMVESNLNFLDEFNEEGGTNFTSEEARIEMLKYFPTLKRWKNRQPI